MSEQEQELKIDIEAVKAMVAEGKDRKEIAKELGITLKECREIVFQSPELKGIRKPQTRKERRKIVLVSGEVPATENTTINTTPLNKESKKSEKKEAALAEKEEESEAEDAPTVTEEETATGKKPSKVQW